MFMALDRMKMKKKVFKDDFRAVDIIIWIVMTKNRSTNIEGRFAKIFSPRFPFFLEKQPFLNPFLFKQW